MEIIVFVDENGTQEGNCEYRAINICDEDRQNLFVMIGHSLAYGYELDKTVILSENEHEDLLKFRNTHPDYMKYIEAQQYIKNFRAKYDINKPVACRRVRKVCD